MTPPTRCLASPIRHSAFGIRHWLCLLFILPLSPFSLSHAAPPPELTVLRTQYEKVVAERVTAPFDASVTELNAKFTAALQNAATGAKQAGKLDEVLAIQDDLKRLAEKLPIPDDTDATPESVKKLRIIYRVQLSKLEEARTANHQTILPAYTAKLEALEITLTKADRIEEAKEVKGYREGLPAGSGASASALASSASSPSSSAASSASKVKGDDRKAAEWLLSIGASFKGLNRGLEVRPKTVAEFPRGMVLADITIDGETNPIKPFTDDDIQCLAGLGELKNFMISKVPLGADGLRFIGTCPNLVKVTVKYMEIEGAFMRHLAALKKLEEIEVVYNRINGVQFSALTSPVLKRVSLGNSGAGDETLAELSRHTSIENLELSNSKVTDAGIVHLTALKKLTAIYVSQTAVTGKGLAPLQGKPITRLGVGTTGVAILEDLTDAARLFPGVRFLQVPRFASVPAETIPTIARLFPELEKLATPDVKMADASWSGLSAMSKLTVLTLDGSDISDAAVSSLQQMKKLESLDVSNSKLTDAALPQIAKIKGLKYLDTRNTAITEPALAAFRKQRPDVRVDK